MEYNILKEFATTTLIVSKSRFICELHPIKNEQEAKEIIQKLRDEHPKARHVCYAYTLLIDNVVIENQSDDGEPSKTAGMPMLEILRHEKLINTIAVVVRYFGGTLLGTGGLIRAYSGVVKDTVDISKIGKAVLMAGFQIEVEYSLNEKLLYELRKHNSYIKGINYLDKVVITCYVNDSELMNYLNNKFNNKLKIIEIDSQYI